MASRNKTYKGFDVEYFRKNSLRLSFKDYSDAGAYFLTICMRRKTGVWLSRIRHDDRGSNVVLTQAGHILERVWQGIPDRYAHVSVDEYVIMPDHFHGVVIIKATRFRDAIEAAQRDSDSFPALTFEQRRASRRQMLLPKVMGYFKMNASRQINLAYRRKGRLWKRSYHDHVIRDAVHLENVRRYIQRNPEEWRKP